MISTGRRLPCAGLILVVLLSSAAHSDVILNEVDINDLEQKVELYNSGGAQVDLTGWRLASGQRDTTFIGVQIPAGGYLLVEFSSLADLDFVQKRGDVLELFEPDLEGIVDRVGFGDSGPAPLDIQNVTSSLARAQGGPDPSGSLAGLNWTVDFTPSFGAANDPPPPNFVREILVNEIIPSGSKRLTIEGEVFNRSLSSIDLSGYRFTNGIDQVFLSGVVGPGSHAFFNIDAIDFEYSLNIYLFNPDLVRVDQFGLSDSPGVQVTWNLAKAEGQSLGRCPDGDGPQRGFDLGSSGFPGFLRRMTPTPGGPNICPLYPFSAWAAALTALILLVLLAGKLVVALRPGSGVEAEVRRERD